MDDVAEPFWCHWVHDPDLLEAQVVSHELALPRWIYSLRSLLYIRRHFVLQRKNRPGGLGIHTRNLRRLDFICVPDQVRLHQLDALLVRCFMDPDYIWYVLHIINPRYGYMLIHP